MARPPSSFLRHGGGGDSTTPSSSTLVHTVSTIILVALLLTTSTTAWCPIPQQSERYVSSSRTPLFLPVSTRTRTTSSILHSTSIEKGAELSLEERQKIKSEAIRIGKLGKIKIAEELVRLNEEIREAEEAKHKLDPTTDKSSSPPTSVEVEVEDPIDKQRQEDCTLIGCDVYPEDEDEDSTTPKSERIYGFLDSKDLTPILYDLLIVGGGPAGIAAALKAAQLGRRAIIIDKPKADPLPTGLDLFFGGPTGLYSKALRDTARSINANTLRAQGLDDDVIWKQVMNTVVRLASRNADGQIRLLDRFKIGYLQGEGTLLNMDDDVAKEIVAEYAEEDDDENGVRVVQVKNAAIRYEGDSYPTENQTVALRANHILIATGSKSMRLPGIPFDGTRVFDSETINTLNFFPRSVVISGAGIIAIEYANIFKALGCESVTLLIRGTLEQASKKLGMDMDVANELIRLLLQSGVQILEGSTISKFNSVPKTLDERIQMTLSDGTSIESDIFLAATGRVPRGSESETGLVQAGVELTDRGAIVLKNKQTLETTSLNVAAAGDVIGPPALASTSVEQAQRAVEGMFPKSTPAMRISEINGATVTVDAAETKEEAAAAFDIDEPLSIGVWTIPEMGYYGLTKEGAEKRGHKVVEGVARFDECLRGRVFAPDGLLKLVVDVNDGRILGVHLIGKEAAEMVHYGMALVKARTTIFELLTTVFTAVTFHELFKEAALDANFKLDFGVEWQEIFNQLGDVVCEVKEGGDGSTTTGGEISLEDLRKRFDSIDVDGSGELDEGELRQLFLDLGRNVSKRTIANLMRLSDVDGNGTIDWDEFQAIFDKINC